MTVLISLAAIRPVAKFAALGGFGVTGPFAPPPIAFLILMTGGLVAWSVWPAFRNALLSLPLTGLIGINAFRIGGICFLILHDRGRLAAPFATSAGWGDIITGVAAVALAGMAAWKGKLPRGLLAVWNAFGALDLTVAIILGALSAPGTPFRLFMGAPGTVVMGTLPWVGVPALLVPLYLMTHLTIAARLRSVGTGHATMIGLVDNRPRGIVTRRAA